MLSTEMFVSGQYGYLEGQVKLVGTTKLAQCMCIFLFFFI